MRDYFVNLEKSCTFAGKYDDYEENFSIYLSRFNTKHC
jgi:hypothetical protein